MVVALFSTQSAASTEASIARACTQARASASWWSRGVNTHLMSWDIEDREDCLRLLQANPNVFPHIFFFKILFIYSRETQRERERERHGQREKQVPCKETNVGLDSRSLDHTTGQRQMLNHWVTQVSHSIPVLNSAATLLGFQSPLCHILTKDLKQVTQSHNCEAEQS